MRLALVVLGRSTRGAMGEGCNSSLVCAWKGRGIDGPPLASASLHGLRPRTILRRTIDPSPYLRSVEPNTARPGLGGALAGWWVWRFGQLRREAAPPEGPPPPMALYVGFRSKHTYGLGGAVGMSYPHGQRARRAVHSLPPQRADVKRGSRSRAGQSAAKP